MPRNGICNKKIGIGVISLLLIHTAQSLLGLGFLALFNHLELIETQLTQAAGAYARILVLTRDD